MKFGELSTGMTGEISKLVTGEDIDMFARATGDVNPVHLDENYASKTVFKHRIAHGMLSAGLVSAVLGTKLPGEGTIYLGQELKFTKPVYVGETVTARATVKELRADKKIVKLETVCVNQKGETVLEGNAVVKLLE